MTLIIPENASTNAFRSYDLLHTPHQFDTILATFISMLHIKNLPAVIFALLILALFSCGKKEMSAELIIEKFPVEETLPGERIDLPLAEHVSNGVFTAGDFYVVNAIRGSFFIMTYDREFNLCDTIVRKGQGPDELSSATYLGQWSGNASDPDILLFDGNTNRLVSAHINPFSGLTPRDALPVSEYLEPSRLYRLPNDSILVGINLTPPNASEIFKYNTAANRLTKYPQPFSFNSRDAFYTSQCNLSFDSETGRFYTFFLSMPWIVIYDADFNILRKVALYEAVNSETLTMNSPTKGFIGPSMAAGKVIALYKDEAAEGEKAQTQLIILDRDGNPLAMYLVGDAIGYTLDIDRQNILTVHYDKEEDVVYLMKRPLPGVLK